MTQRKLERLVRTWQKKLGIERWDIKIMWGVAPETYGVAAEIETNKNYDSAKLRFNLAFKLWTDQFAEEIVIHELLHVLHNQIDKAVESITSDLSPAGKSIADPWYEIALETFIDRMALRLYEIDRADR